MESGGNVCGAVYEYFECLLRSVASLPSETVSATIRFFYAPRPRDVDIQTRLNLSLIVQEKNRETSVVLSKIIENGPLWRYFDLARGGNHKIAWSKIKASCDVVRREDAFEPLFTSEFNDRIRGPYYVVHSFVPKDKNDFLLLDNILGSLNECAIVDISLEPLDIASVLHHHTRYLSISGIHQSHMGY